MINKKIIIDDTKKSSKIMTFVVLGIATVTMFGLALSVSAATISSQLGLGSSGPDVTTLQTYLAANPNLYPSGLITGYFGPLTEEGVENFQTLYGIVSSGTATTTGFGRVGPMTLAKLNSLISGGISSGSSGSSPAGPTTAPMISGVNIQTTSNSAIVNWTTNENSQSQVYYGTQFPQMTEATANYTAPTISGLLQSNPTLVVSHSLTLSNLTPNTTYYYVIQSIDSSGNVSDTWPATFTTNSY